jgi:uncharacterized protein
MDLVISKINAGDIHLFSIASKHFIFDPTTHSIFSVTTDKLEELNKEIEEAIQKGFFTRVEEAKFHDKRVFKSLCLMITHNCNFSCTYCFEKDKINPGIHVMSLEVGQRSLKLITELSQDRINIEIDFFGGEPLLYFDTLRQIVAYGRNLENTYNKKFWFSLTTNASLITDEIMSFLIAENISLILSIDGDKKAHDLYRVFRDGTGTFSDTWKGIQKVIQSEHKGYYVRGTYTKETPDFLNQVLYLEALGLEQISFEPVVSEDPVVSFTKKDLPLLRRTYEKLADEYIVHRKNNPNLRFYHFEVNLEEGSCLQKLMTSCGAGVEYLSVSPDGKLYPCHQFDGNHTYELGNVDNGINNPALVERLRSLTNVGEKEKCNFCWARTLCGGGCLANNLSINKDLNKIYDLGCEIQKIRFEAALYVQTQLKEINVS